VCDAMPDNLPASEFGGKPLKTGVQPSPHQPTSSERLMNLYRTGEEAGPVSQVPDSGEVFAGLLPGDVQTETRKNEGALDKGQVWKEIVDGSSE
jgi:hypothetical protein